MGRRQRRRGSPINGVVLLDKPLNWSSNDAVQRVRGVFKAQKVGHTGTLDKLATGVLPLCLGEATKFSSFGLSASKTYEVTAELGITTASGDADSEVLERKPVPNFSHKEIEEVLTYFRGEIQQIPSMYSALKHQGQPLYKLARQKIEVEREPRPVTIYENRLDQFQDNKMGLRVVCSKGTYIRTLIDDIGRELGCGAYVTSLRRLAVGNFTIDQCATFDELVKSRNEERLDEHLRATDTLVSDLPLVEFPHSSAYVVRQGRALKAPRSAPTCGWVRLFEINAEDSAQFMGIGEIHEGRVAPRRLISLTNS